MFGYTEPFRRFVQNEALKPQANNIQNTAASWLPGDDYYTNFHEGDPFIKVDDGYARLPGAGYAALHPEVKDLDPEDYPDIHKMAILADVAPYSREYNTYRQRVGAQAHSTNDTELEIEYEKILNRVKQTRESVIRMQDRHFTNPVEEIAGTVESASPGGVTLKEYPGRRFQFSSVSTSAADMSARILGNRITRCLHPCGHKTPHARAPDGGSIHDPALAPPWFPDPAQGGDRIGVSVLAGAKHFTGLRQAEAQAMIRFSPLAGSLILLRERRLARHSWLAARRAQLCR
jgi:hypothetical protein